MRNKILIQNISANLKGFLTTFLVISNDFFGFRYWKKSYDDNSPDPKTPMNKIVVEHLVDPKFKQIGDEINVLFVVTWLHIPVG